MCEHCFFFVAFFLLYLSSCCKIIAPFLEILYLHAICVARTTDTQGVYGLPSLALSPLTSTPTHRLAAAGTPSGPPPHTRDDRNHTPTKQGAGPPLLHRYYFWIPSVQLVCRGHWERRPGAEYGDQPAAEYRYSQRGYDGQPHDPVAPGPLKSFQHAV